MQDALRSLPKTLDETYTRIILGIPEGHREKAIRALKWVAFSLESIKLNELAEAMIIDAAADPPFDPRNRIFDKSFVFELLGPLIITKWEYRSGEPHKMIKLAHFSVKEYLESVRIRQTHAREFFMEDHKAKQDIVEESIL